MPIYTDTQERYINGLVHKPGEPFNHDGKPNPNWTPQDKEAEAMMKALKDKEAEEEKSDADPKSDAKAKAEADAKAKTDADAKAKGK